MTNGIGGFAAGTAIGANTRRYHGLLVSSLNPPVERFLHVAKIDEVLHIGNERFDLSANRTGDYCGDGYRYLVSFSNEPVPTFTYYVEGVWLIKQIAMVHGKNISVVYYKVETDRADVWLELTPLTNYRDYHGDNHKDHMHLTSHEISDGVEISVPYREEKVFLTTSLGKFEGGEDYYYGMFYQKEAERGLGAFEDHFIPGKFIVPIHKKSAFTVTAGVGSPETLDGEKVIRDELKRKNALVKKARSFLSYKKQDAVLDRLVLAADDFLAERRSTNAKTILAGYPWFSDWGRDAMISLPGLLLSTGRMEEAKEVLDTFSRVIKDGLVPNCFPDEGGEPWYNTVDASLWYIVAVYQYVKNDGDVEHAKATYYPKIMEIIEAYQKGTLHKIHMEPDGLIAAGDSTTQLTWMDASAGGVVFTPRHGKCVEINALWYNALMVVAELMPKHRSLFTKLSKQVRESFVKAFWNEEAGALYDTVNDEGKDARIRPNQIFAISLPFSLLEPELEKKVFDTVMGELYTPYGLRSLSGKDKDYHGVYTSSNFERDEAYHQGTAWGWLMGAFFDAAMKVGVPKTALNDMMKNALNQLNHGCLGTCAEIFDGNAPYKTRGCFAQAWSVAELLRAYIAFFRL